MSLYVGEGAPPLAFVLVKGKARAEAEAEDLLYRATHIARRYMGADRAEEYGRRNSVTLTKVVANKNVSD